MASDGIHIINAWEPTSPPKTQKDLTKRDPVEYVTIIQQFDVEANIRYKKNKVGLNETYCNIFVWDCTAALGCEIPHWVDSQGVKVEKGKGKELNANAVVDWLAGPGLHKNNWMLCSEGQAKIRASKGFPTVVVWKNLHGIGHVAMVMPSPSNTLISQAGGTNFFNDDLHRGFGTIPNLLFYTHD